MERIYPRLKTYCSEYHGLDFQVVDMRWGVRDESTDEHKTAELCMNEIEACQRLSLGPNFVVNKFFYNYDCWLIKYTLPELIHGNRVLIINIIKIMTTPNNIVSYK